MLVSYTDRSLVSSRHSATASWMREAGQLWPVPREICPHMGTINSASSQAGFTAT